MPFPEFEPIAAPAPEANFDVSNLAGPEPLTFGAEQQLSAPGDVSSASQFFQGNATTALPELTLSDGGASTMAPNLPGAEAASITLAPGADSAALVSALPPPGGEPISPLIQLIMKMPGAMGVLNSFFEVLGAIFGGGNLIALFDPILWLQHASASITSFTVSFVEGLPQALMQNTFTTNNWFTSLAEQVQKAAVSSTSTQVSPLTSHPIAGGSLNVSGPANLNKPLFEGQSSELIAQGPGANMYGDVAPGNFYASNSGGQLMGNFSQSPNATSSLGTQPSAIPNNTTGLTGSPGGDSLAADADAGSNIQAPATDQPPTSADGNFYTVKPGDNLWDISKHQFGDGSRWTEVYQSNQSVIGSNPDLIHPGQQLDLSTASNPDAVAMSNPSTSMSQPAPAMHHQGTAISHHQAPAVSHHSASPGHDVHHSQASGHHSSVVSHHTPAQVQHTPAQVQHTPPISHHVTTANTQLAQATPHATSAEVTIQAPQALHAQQPQLDTSE